MANETRTPELTPTQQALKAELEQLREKLFRHASNVSPEDESSEDMLALVRVCRGLSLEDGEALVHDLGLTQWLPLPLSQRDFPFLSQLQSHLEDLSLQSSRDSLTLLINRRAFERHIHLELQRSRRENLALSLAYISLDDFGHIVGSHGRTCADQVLIAFSRLLLKHKRAYDSAAHLDEDQFALLLPGVGLFEAQILLERLLKEFSAINFGPEGCSRLDNMFHAAFCAGLTHVRGPRKVTVQDLMLLAESALADAKSPENPARIALARPAEEQLFPKESMVQTNEKRFLFSGCE